MTEINCLCQPLDEVSDDEHKHQCEHCGTCWKHKNDAVENASDEEADAVFDEAHTCPTCGKQQTWKLRKDGTQVPVECRENISLFAAFLRGGIF